MKKRLKKNEERIEEKRRIEEEENRRKEKRKEKRREENLGEQILIKNSIVKFWNKYYTGNNWWRHCILKISTLMEDRKSVEKREKKKNYEMLLSKGQNFNSNLNLKFKI